MPTYDYACEKCGKTFEVSQRITEAPLTDCPDEICGGKGSVKRLISSGAGLIFKGSGFYQTDYKGNGKTKSEAPPKTESCETCSAEPGSCPNKD